MMSLSLNSFDTIPLFARFGEAPLYASTYSGPGRVFLPYWGTAVRICLRYTKNRKDAENWVVEVFTRVIKDSNGSRCRNPLICIYLAAVDCCIRNLKRQKSTNNLDLQDLSVETLGVLQKHFDRNLAKDVLQHILEKARPTTRKILFLNLLEGHTPEKIARMLDTSLLTVLNRIHQFETEMKRVSQNGESLSLHLSSWKVFRFRHTRWINL
jgi:DNA-directed RNA polymerase specialized sigma24 family protein